MILPPFSAWSLLSKLQYTQQKATAETWHSPDSCANDEGEDVGDEEGVEHIPGEEGRVAHHDAADAGPTAHSLARMTKPPFPVEILLYNT